MTTLKINAARLLADLKALAEIGATAEGGVSRPALSEADLEGRKWFKKQIDRARLLYRQDAAGNQSAILPSEDTDAGTILIGSHLDTVPDGGRYDGALGTLAALEVLRTVQEGGLKLPVHLEAINFTDEEGTVMGLMGSRAVAGLLTEMDFEQPRGGPDVLEAGLQRLKLYPERMLRARRTDIQAFIELHIEQGTRLEEADAQIGVVTAMVGIRSFRLRFHGEAAHAGTMPMDRRHDALWGAAAFIGQAREAIMARHSPGVVNFGQISARPGAFNIVPAGAEVWMEFRHGGEPELEAMQAELLALAQQAADQHRLTLTVEPTPHIPPAPMHPRIINALERAASQLGLRHMPLLSFAGHDTQAISTIAPAAMIFVPSVDGISHNPAEYTRDEDVINGANLMLQTVLLLARGLA